MSVEAEFRERLREVSFYLRSLKDIEKRQLARSRMFYRSPEALAASRAAAFIMIYNCVEFGTKQALSAVRNDVATNVANFEELVEYWQHEIIRNRFGRKLSDGINFESFLIDIRKSMPVKASWLREAKPLPFSGNINHERLIDLARRIGGHRWKPPKSSLGGVDLETVRKARNDLAHGDETFEDLGRQYTLADISDKLIRIRDFMCSYIRMLERYRAGAHYRVST